MKTSLESTFDYSTSLQAQSITKVSQKSKKCLIVICAYNEEKSLPSLLQALKGKDVLIVDDGSSDNTRSIAVSSGASILNHEIRLGKAAALADAISYALQNLYEWIIEVGADAIPGSDAIAKIESALENESVGAVSGKQVPIGQSAVAYRVDELMWAILAQGKKLQMAKQGTSHLGAVMFGFKTKLVESVRGSVNDDEELGVLIAKKGYVTMFEEKAIAYFDASSCLGHILERRTRMYYGHLKFSQSTAPSMQFSTSSEATLKVILEKPSRIVWLLPTLCLDLLSRLLAWRDSKDSRKSKRYMKWVTTYAKDNTLVIRNSLSN